jgi:hypothetical protein
MTIRIATLVRNAALEAINTAANAGAAAATIKVYSGSQPATADTAASGTLLATFTCADPAFEVAASGAIDLDANPDLTTTVATAGTAGWARMQDSNGLNIFDGSVGTSTTDFIINSTTLTVGQTVTLSTGTLTFPA